MTTQNADVTVELTGRQRSIRRVYVVLAGLFAIGVLVQVFLAGMAVFLDSSHWELHVTFVHLIELIPVVLILLGFLGNFGRRLKVLPGILVGLLALQYITVGMPDSIIAAFHPVNALLIFWVSVVTTRESWEAL